MLNYVLEAYKLLDDASVNGSLVNEFLSSRGVSHCEVTTVENDKVKTDFIKITFVGVKGKIKDGDCPTLNIIGQLGGIAAYPNIIGLLSDADGAIVAIACALCIQNYINKGYCFLGDVIITTHICTSARTIERDPVVFVDLPTDVKVMNQHLVVPDADAVLSIDATKGNKVLSEKGIAITPTVKEGYILRVSDHLIDILGIVTAQPAKVLPITTQDITPYGNGIYHINTIMQPAAATDAPVVGIAITSAVVTPGCATLANDLIDLEMAARFAVEIARRFGEGLCEFYSVAEFETITELYGSMKQLFQ